MTREELNAYIDENVTNKTEINSLSPTDEGGALKAVADYVDQKLNELAESLQPYKKYRALLTQVGTDNPIVVDLMENTLGGEVVWSRDSEGVYLGVLTSGFPNTKTYCMLGTAGVGVDYSVFPLDNNTIQLKTWNNQTTSFSDGQLNESYIEILVSIV